MDQLAFHFSLPRNIKLPEAKTKDQTIQKRTEPGFIEPMQCKPVTALPAGGNWTFELKFDGYHCIAVKRGSVVTLFSRHQKVLNKRFPWVVDALASLDGDFVLDGELVALDSQGRPSFQILQNNLSRSLPVYFYCFDLLNRDGEALVAVEIERRRDLLHRMFARQKIRCASLRYFTRHRAKFLRRCANLVWKASWANESTPLTSPAGDQGLGSSTARTWNRNSSSAGMSRAPADSMRCSWAFTRMKSSSLLRR